MSKMELMLDISSLEALLRGQRNQMREQQTRFLEHLLFSAEHAVTKAPQAKVHLHDPWADKVALPPVHPKHGESSKYHIIHYGPNHYPVDSRGTVVQSPATEVVSTSPVLPRYKSIIRLGPNALAENDRRLKYLPYFIEEENGIDKNELYRELGQRFDKLPEDLHARRRCSERAAFWREAVEDLMTEVGVDATDVMYYLLLTTGQLKQYRPRGISQKALEQYMTRTDHCVECGTSFRRGSWVHVSYMIQRPANDMCLAVAGLLCQAVSNVIHSSIWHIISKDSKVQDLLRRARSTTDKGDQVSDFQHAKVLRCSICYLHECPGHGMFSEQDHAESEGEASLDEETDSESELKQNNRKTVNTVKLEDQEKKAAISICGVYCVDNSVRIRDLLGLDTGGNVTGVANNQYREASDVSIYSDKEVCSQTCFWRRSEREDTTVKDLLDKRRPRFLGWPTEDVAKYESQKMAFGKKRRGACVIATSCSVGCYRVWEELLTDMQSRHRPHPTIDLPSKAATTRDAKWWQDNSFTHLLDKRAPFVPCSHDGPCEGNSLCTCFKERISCEHFCKCTEDCVRRFRGCNCRGVQKHCFGDDRCECYALGRECDPWLCGCGVTEVLDPTNRDDETISRRSCRNASLQRDIPKRTIKNHSEVQGWGLFAGEDIKANDFIGEYKGEIISSEESDRRGAVYHHRGVEYLFRLNRDQEVDSTRAGNKMRFINNSQLKKNINCFARLSFCNGVQRIGLYAKRDIKAGEEMFFNYGYPDSVVKAFWEKGEKGPANRVRHPSDDSSEGEGRNKQVYAAKERKKYQKRKKGTALTLPRRSKSELGDLFTSNSPAASATRKRRYDHQPLDERPPPANSNDKMATQYFTNSQESQATSPPRYPEIPESDEDDSWDLDAKSSDSGSFSGRSDDVEEEMEDFQLNTSSSSSHGESDLEIDMASPSTPTRPSASRSTKRSPATKATKRTLNPSKDTRYGGAAQKKGWQTRKKNKEREERQMREQRQKKQKDGKKRGKKREKGKGGGKIEKKVGKAAKQQKRLKRVL